VNPTPPASRKSVFIVDDHPLVQEWLSGLINEQPDLEVCGYAETVDEAIAAIARLRPNISIIDIGLNGKSGLELIRYLTEENPEELTLVLSMHDEAVYAQRAFRVGARGYVTKRQTSEKVIMALRRILAGGSYVNETLADAIPVGLGYYKNALTLDPVSLLSDRELEIFRLLADGRQSAEIASVLSVRQKTVQSYCARIKDKLNLRNATELLQAATRWVDAQNKA
jgi:DNA-binding NarL/FixJ family response regulator